MFLAISENQHTIIEAFLKKTETKKLIKHGLMLTFH